MPNCFFSYTIRQQKFLPQRLVLINDRWANFSTNSHREHLTVSTSSHSTKKQPHGLWSWAGSTASSTMTYKPCKLGQTDVPYPVVFGLCSEFIGRSVHAGYKSLNATVMTCATLVNMHTERQLLTSYTISSASRDNSTTGQLKVIKQLRNVVDDTLSTLFGLYLWVSDYSSVASEAADQPRWHHHEGVTLMEV